MRCAEIAQANKSLMGILTVPYWAGMITATTAGFISIPLVFHLDLVMWFNENYGELIHDICTLSISRPP